MTVELLEMFAGRDVPHDDALVVAHRRKHRAVGAEGSMVTAASWPANTARRLPLAVSNSPMRSCVVLIAMVRPSGLRARAPSPSKRPTSAPLARWKATVGPAPLAYKRRPSGENRIHPDSGLNGAISTRRPTSRRLRRLAGSSGASTRQTAMFSEDPDHGSGPIAASDEPSGGYATSAAKNRNPSYRTPRVSGRGRRTPRRPRRRSRRSDGTASGTTTRRRRRHRD